MPCSQQAAERKGLKEELWQDARSSRTTSVSEFAVLRTLAHNLRLRGQKGEMEGGRERRREGGRERLSKGARKLRERRQGK
eukprot:5643547-Pleurochrysis_carterae.AAC.1